MRVLVNTADPFSSFFTRNKAAVTTESTEESKYTHFLPGGRGRAAAPAPGRGGRSRGRAGAPRFLPALQGPSGRQVRPAEPRSPPREGAGWPSLRCTSPGPAAAAPARPPQLALPHRLSLQPDAEVREQVLFPLGSLSTPRSWNGAGHAGLTLT